MLNKNTLIVTLILLFTSYTCGAHMLNGLVTDQETNEALAFANIGIRGKSTGTLSAEDGSFTLEVADKLLSDTLRVSFIGYEEWMKPIKELLKEKNIRIQLKRKNYLLNEVAIYNFDKVDKREKKWNMDSRAVLNYKGNDGYECGNLVKVKHFSVLQSISVYIHSLNTDSVQMRLKVYTMKGREVGECINRQPIYFYVKKEDVGTFKYLNLEKYGIEYKGDVLISLEAINFNEKDHLILLGNMGKGQYYQRKVSQDTWFNLPTIPVCIVMNVTMQTYSRKMRRQLKNSGKEE